MGNAYITGAHTPSGKTIVAITLMSGNALTATSENAAIWPDLSAATVAVGTTVYGRYTSVTPGGSSPAAIVYYG